MTDDKVRVQLNLIEKAMKEGFEKINKRLSALDLGFESNQERFDVLEEHAVLSKDDMGELKERQDRLEMAVMEQVDTNNKK